MSSLFLEMDALGRLQLRNSRMGRRDSVGSTFSLRFGCLGRTQAILTSFQSRKQRKRENVFDAVSALRETREFWLSDGREWEQGPLKAICFGQNIISSEEW